MKREIPIRAGKSLTFFLGLLCALPVSVSVSAENKCTLGKVAEIPITMVDLRPQTAAKINGKDVRFLVDSGASFSIISPASAAELNLPLRPTPGFYIAGSNGNADASITKVKQFVLAGVTIPNIDFIVAGSQIDEGGVGVLGQNVLHVADVEFDLSQGVVRLMKPMHCDKKATLAYWVVQDDSPFSQIDIQSSDRQDSAIGHASINGKDIRVLFDSGADVSVLTLSAAARLGIKPGSPGVVAAGVTTGFGRNKVATYIAPFDSFKIGDEEIRHTRLRISDLDAGDADMLIGADFFLSHRIYIANSQQKLYFSYNGGHVFDLRHFDEKGEPVAADAAPAVDAGAGSGGAGAAEAPKAGARNPEEAAEHSRRGNAMASRNDYAHALTELKKACELAPDNAEYFYQRAQLYVRMENGAAALKDLDQTLKLNPHHAMALVARADLRLADGDEEGAIADLDAADAAIAKQDDLRYQMAELYGSAERWEKSVAQADFWIDAHREDAYIPNARRLRCQSRTLAGKDLALALKDCDAALRRADKASAFYAVAASTRGLVLLRLGDFSKSIADYDAAIKIAPKDAWSWYGRGVDKLRQHQTAAGEADIAQAKSLSPKIAETFARYNVEP